MSHFHSQLKTALIILCFGCFSISSFAFTQRNLLQEKAEKHNISEMLIKNQQWVPYPAYTNRAGWDALLGQYKSEYIRRGENAFNYKWEVIPASSYLEYERSGSRKIMEDPNKKNNLAIVDLFFAELAEGEGRFLDKLIDGVFFSCEMTSWTLSAHLSPQKSGRSLPEKDENIVALVSSDMGSVFSWIYYFFHEEFDKVNPEISKRLKSEINRRVLEPFLARDFWWMGFDYKEGMIINNWNPWCNFNVLQCFMLLEDDEERLARAVEKGIRSVDQFINYSNNDGACEEGPSYWGHAAGKMYDYLQLLYDVTGGKISLFDEPMIKNMGEYIAKSYVGDGWVVNFADASAKLNPEPDLIYRYGKAVNSDEMKSFASYLFNGSGKNNVPNFGRDVYRTMQTLRFRDELKQLPVARQSAPYTWYPKTEFCYMKSEKGLFFAAKGGYNNESHNHNDVGTFSLYCDNTPILIDVGVGTYTRQTFSSERYSIWTMQSIYHNLPEINGLAQQYGQQYKSRDAIFNPSKKMFSLELIDAYPRVLSQDSWKRIYQLAGRTLKITDQFTIKNPTVANKLHFMTWGNVDIAKNYIEINVDGKTMHLKFNEHDFTPSIEPIKLDDPRLSNVWGDMIYRITLTAKNVASKGEYKISISKEK